MMAFLFFSFLLKASLSHFDLKPEMFLAPSFSLSTKGWKQVSHYNLEEEGLLGEYFLNKKNMVGSLTIRRTPYKPVSLLALKRDFLHIGFQVDRVRKITKGIFIFELFSKKTKKKIIQISFSKKDHLIVLTCKAHESYFEKIRPQCIKTINSFQWVSQKL